MCKKADRFGSPPQQIKTPRNAWKTRISMTLENYYETGIVVAIYEFLLMSPE